MKCLAIQCMMNLILDSERAATRAKNETKGPVAPCDAPSWIVLIWFRKDAILDDGWTAWRCRENTKTYDLQPRHMCRRCLQECENRMICMNECKSGSRHVYCPCGTVIADEPELPACICFNVVMVVYTIAANIHDHMIRVCSESVRSWRAVVHNACQRFPHNFDVGRNILSNNKVAGVISQRRTIPEFSQRELHHFPDSIR